MMSRINWHFVAALVWFASSAPALCDLYESRDLSDDWIGLVLLLNGFLFLYGGYRAQEAEYAKPVEKSK
jgi:hypothetical protein